jgi:hypothetical protein
VLVLCTGMIRSGSTWSYNVARLLLARCAPRVIGGYADSPVPVFLQHGLDVDHCVLKCHEPDRAARALVKHRLCRTIYTYREPIDCLSSGAAIGMPFDAMLKRLRASLELFQFQIETGGVHVIWYDDITGRPRDRVRTIADYLELDAGDEIVDTVAEMLSHENVRQVIRNQRQSKRQVAGQGGLLWDAQTLFNEKHIRDNPADPAQTISATQRAAIAQALPEWTDAGGRLTPAVRAYGMLTPPDPESDAAPDPAPEVAPESATEAAPALAPVEAEPAIAADVAAPAPDAADPSALVVSAETPIDDAADAAPPAEAEPTAAATEPAATPPAPAPAQPVRPATPRPTEAARLRPEAAAERQRLARELLSLIDTQARRAPLSRR